MLFRCTYNLSNISECTGSMKLLRQMDTKIVNIDSRKIREKGRGKRSIRAPGMRFAEVSGSCCWEVRTRKYGGDFMHLKTVETHALPWEIKFVQLIKCSVWLVLNLQLTCDMKRLSEMIAQFFSEPKMKAKYARNILTVP